MKPYRAIFVLRELCSHLDDLHIVNLLHIVAHLITLLQTILMLVLPQ